MAAGALAPLDEALTHTSAGHHRDHERLEFLGDAVLRLAASEFLRRHQADLPVGRWSALRAQLVSDRWLAELAEQLELASVVRHGPMALAERGGRATVLAECCEALIGAVYLDKGYRVTRDFIIGRIIRPHVDLTEIESTEKNFKEFQRTLKNYTEF